MAVNTQVLFDGRKYLILNIMGTSPNIATVVVDVSTLNPPCLDVSLLDVSYDVGVDDPEAGTANVTLSWDATADVPFIVMTSGSGQTRCFKKIGGITNPMVAAGSTGDVLLDSTGAVFSVVALFRKKY